MHGGEGAPISIASPVDGFVADIADVSDPMFAAEVMGPSSAIEPSGCSIIAPAAGLITLVARTRHALMMKADGGVELLIHIGVDTNQLAGEPFGLHVEVGDRVAAGEILLDVDFGIIRAAELDPTVIVIITNPDGLGSVETAAAGPIRAGEELMRVLR